MKDATLNYDQQFFVDGLELSGVQSIAGGYYINEAPVNVLGFGNVGVGFFGNVLDGSTPKEMAALVSPIEGRFSLDSILVTRDIFLDYTGGLPFTGSINIRGSGLGFESGYIADHRVHCSVGQLPRTSSTIYAFGDVGSGIDANRPGKPWTDYPEIQLTNQENIKVQCKGTGTNRVVNAEYAINVELAPLYVIGSTFPVQVDVNWPIVAEMSFRLEVEEFEYQSMRDYFTKPTLNDVSIQISDCDQNVIQEYAIQSGRLIRETTQTNVDGVLTVDLGYRTYYNKR